MSTSAIDFDDLGLCEYGAGTNPAKREPDACRRPATNITEEGYRWCHEHARAFYASVAAIEGKP